MGVEEEEEEERKKKITNSKEARLGLFHCLQHDQAI